MDDVSERKGCHFEVGCHRGLIVAVDESGRIVDKSGVTVDHMT